MEKSRWMSAVLEGRLYEPVAAGSGPSKSGDINVTLILVLQSTYEE